MVRRRKVGIKKDKSPKLWRERERERAKEKHEKSLSQSPKRHELHMSYLDGFLPYYRAN